MKIAYLLVLVTLPFAALADDNCVATFHPDKQYVSKAVEKSESITFIESIEVKRMNAESRNIAIHFAGGKTETYLVSMMCENGELEAKKTQDNSEQDSFVCQKNTINCFPPLFPGQKKYCFTDYKIWHRQHCSGEPKYVY